MSSRVFHQVAARLGVATVAPAGVALWALGPVAALGAGTAFLATEVMRVRKLVLAAMPQELGFAMSSPADYAWLDKLAFQAQLAELSDAGFSPIADYTLTYPGAPDGHARLLIDSARRMYAEVNQVREGSNVVPVATTIRSVLSDGWSLQTTAREAPATMVAFMQAPRAAWHSLPGASVSELIDDHLEMRQAMCDSLGITVEGDGSVQGYFDAEQATHEARRDNLSWMAVARGVGRGLAVERAPSQPRFGGFRPPSPA